MKYKETTQYTKTIMKGMSMKYRTLHNKKLRDWASHAVFFYDGTERVMQTHKTRNKADNLLGYDTMLTGKL